MAKPPSALAPLLIAHAGDAYAVADAGEAQRAKRTRLVAVAAVVAALAIGAVVVYSTGLGDFLAGKRGATPPAATSAAVPGGTNVGDVAAGGTAAPAEPAPAAAAPATTGPAFGLQVASFRTAGRATRVLHDYEETTGLPGEVLTSADDGDDPWYRIVLGRFAGESEARNRGDDLLARSLIAEAIVIPYTPRVDKPTGR